MTRFQGHRLPLDDATRDRMLAALPPDSRAEMEDAYVTLGEFRRDAGVLRRIGRKPLRLGDLMGVAKMAKKALDLRLVRMSSAYLAAKGPRVVALAAVETEWEASEFPDGRLEADSFFHRKGIGRGEPPLLLWLHPDEEAQLSGAKANGIGLAFGALLIFGVMFAPLFALLPIPGAGWIAVGLVFLVPYLFYKAWVARARSKLRSAPKTPSPNAFMAASITSRQRPSLDSLSRWAAQDAGLPPARAQNKPRSSGGGAGLNTIYAYEGGHEIATSSFGWKGVEQMMLSMTDPSGAQAHRRLKGYILAEARRTWTEAFPERPKPAEAPPLQVATSLGWKVHTLPSKNQFRPPFVQADLEVGPPGATPEAAAKVGVCIRRNLPRAAPIASEAKGAWRWAEIGNHSAVDLTPKEGGGAHVRVQGSLLPNELPAILESIALAMGHEP